MALESTTIEPTSALRELPAAMRALHRVLLQECRTDYERAHGPVNGPGPLLHLAMHDPFFAWLRVLSALMADLDELLEEKAPATEEEVAAVRAELEETFSPAVGTFWDRFMPSLQNPDVAIDYHQLLALIARLPPPPDLAARLHAQHRWNVLRRKRGIGAPR